MVNWQTQICFLTKHELFAAIWSFSFHLFYVNNVIANLNHLKQHLYIHVYRILQGFSNNMHAGNSNNAKWLVKLCNNFWITDFVFALIIQNAKYKIRRLLIIVYQLQPESSFIINLCFKCIKFVVHFLYIIFFLRFILYLSYVLYFYFRYFRLREFMCNLCLKYIDQIGCLTSRWIAWRHKYTLRVKSWSRFSLTFDQSFWIRLV